MFVVGLPSIERQSFVMFGCVSWFFVFYCTVLSTATCTQSVIAVVNCCVKCITLTVQFTCILSYRGMCCATYGRNFDSLMRLCGVSLYAEIKVKLTTYGHRSIRLDDTFGSEFSWNDLGEGSVSPSRWLMNCECDVKRTVKLMFAFPSDSEW